ncbi:ATP-binding protein [Novosphingobium sp. LASN5T]|uniref:ATP-binding protein n=1 Tax=Novosphingobium sp. LASN5T TaxID=2491021 RepID=UPI0016818925|nr:ATP-binding protein [Novosphingobium sp. LASN5T]
MRPEHGFLPTTIARTILSRMQIVHDTQRIAIFSGPPGIGKTTAINEFVSANPGEAEVVTIKKENASSRIVIQYALEAVRRLTDNIDGHVYTDTYLIGRQFRKEVAKLADYNGFDREAMRLTLIFDEAQTLTKTAIEELRHWNDAADNDLPFKIGLIFVGNEEFSLKSSGSGQSVISAAVSDRARFIESFSYSDLTDGDLAAFIHAHGIDDAEAVSAIVRRFSGPRAVRSFRRVADLIEDLAMVANGEPVTAEIVKSII